MMHLFRIDAVRVGARRVSAQRSHYRTCDALRTILRYRLQLAGLPVDFATLHGLRAGFLTQAALDGAPLAAAMKLSLHRSAVQAQKYYADVEISENPAADLLGD